MRSLLVMLLVTAIAAGFILVPTLGGKSTGSLPKLTDLSYTGTTLTVDVSGYRTLGSVDDWRQLNRRLTDYDSVNYYDGWSRTTLEGAGFGSADSMATNAPAPAAMPQTADMAKGANGYSSTNEQVVGVNEGDIVKTDGKYLYIGGYYGTGQQVRIVEVNDGAVKQVSSITLPDDKERSMSFGEMFVVGDRLVLVASEFIADKQEAFLGDAVTDSLVAPDIAYYGGKSMTNYMVYDIADRAAPKLVRTVSAQGGSLATRMVGNVLYFFTNDGGYYSYYRLPGEAADEPLPCWRDTVVSDDLVAVKPDHIGVIDEPQDKTQLFYGAFDITAEQPCDIKALFGCGSTVYVSPTAAYVTQNSYSEKGDTLKIHKFVMAGVDMAYYATGETSGYVLNNYSMDEYNSHFRVARNVAGKGNCITVFDGAMKQVGETPFVEEKEQIKSVRFMGDVGYMVTYENTDPLFVVDLSDPTKPTLLGELKIPGFSQYLHPVGDGLLIGIGRHTTPTYVKDENGKEIEVGSTDLGMKVSLFDVRDATQPKQIDQLVLGEGFAEVCDNPRALMVDGNGRFAFAYDGYSSQSGVSKASGLVFAVENDKLVKRAALQATDRDGYGSRFVAIGDKLYWVSNGKIHVYDASYTEIGKVSF